MAATVESYGDYSFMREDTGKRRSLDKRGVLARWFNAFIASREAWAKDAVDAHLTTLSDAELVRLGNGPERIAEIRTNIRGSQTFML